MKQLFEGFEDPSDGIGPDEYFGPSFRALPPWMDIALELLDDEMVLAPSHDHWCPRITVPVRHQVDVQVRGELCVENGNELLELDRQMAAINERKRP